MNDNKITFVVYKTDDEKSKSLIETLGEITIPNGYESNVLVVNGGDISDKYQIYNKIIEINDSKYKIYLNENIELLSKDFLTDILDIFNSDESIGIIGFSGAIKLSTHGISLKSEKRCGKIYTGDSKELVDWSKSETEEKYQEVETVDNFFIATQYDIKWRDDLFIDDIFGETAQCLEFKRKGYKSVVVNQAEPVIWYKENSFGVEAKDKEKFLDEYSKDLFPSVLILIPTFNRPKYFQNALESALNQSYKNLDIVISDNSPNEDTKELIQPYLEKNKHIKYFYHHEFDANDNWNFLRQYQKNDTEHEFVNWLMDDDAFLPNKIEIMMEAMLNNPDVSLVTSARNFIDGEGNYIKSYEWLDNVVKIAGEEIGKKLLMTYHNYVGEPTTVLIRKSCLRDGDLCWNDDENGFFAYIDISTWLQLLSKGNMIWINEPLSMFRIHEDQATFWAQTKIRFNIEWLKLLLCAWNKKIFLKTEEDLRETLLIWFTVTVKHTLWLTYDNDYQSKDLNELKKLLSEVSKALISNNYKIKHKIISKSLIEGAEEKKFVTVSQF